MASKRDMLRKMNEKNNSKQGNRPTTLVTELVDNYADSEEIKEKPAAKPKDPEKKTKDISNDQAEAEKPAKAFKQIDTSDLVGTARRRVSQKIEKSGAGKLQKLNRTTISLSENNEEYVMNRCEETGASITVTINKIIQEYRELKGI